MELPLRIIRPFLGMRIIKTGIAVFLSLAVFHGWGQTYAAFAGVSAILAIQPSVSRAKAQFLQQLVSNVLGGVVGALLGLAMGTTPLAMALAVVLVLGLCVRFGLNETANLAVVAVVFIMDRPHGDFLLYTLIRIGAIVVGTLIGFLVNRYIYPPNFADRLRSELHAATDLADTFLKRLVSSLAAPEYYRKEAIKADAEEIRKHLEAARYYLDLYRESRRLESGLLQMDKAMKSLFVFLERIMDIHKLVLQAGGLAAHEPEAERVAAALTALRGYKADVLRAALDGGRTRLDPAVACAEAVAALHDRAQSLVADPETRALGLSLHSVLVSIRHMVWRMESLSRLIDPAPVPEPTVDSLQE